MKLSDDAVGAIMMALQKGIMEQTDITNILLEFDLQDTDNGLVVLNPPFLKQQKAAEKDKMEDA